ncbi:MAG: NADH-quinone oxidoreductase subunit NuoK [Phycisphaerae bacterium]
MLTIGLLHYLVLAAALFCCGIFVMLTKRNAIGILIGIELLLNGVNINFVAFDRYRLSGGIDGQITALFVVVMAAAEAAVAVAICMNVYKSLSTIDVDRGDALHG